MIQAAGGMGQVPAGLGSSGLATAAAAGQQGYLFLQQQQGGQQGQRGHENPSPNSTPGLHPGQAQTPPLNIIEMEGRNSWTNQNIFLGKNFESWILFDERVLMIQPIF